MRIVWLFSIVLGHPRHIFARFVMHQDLQTLLRCHMLAFTALGGVPIEILYDASHDGLVSIGGNYYSVPHRTRRVVEVHQIPDQICILDEGRLVATHPILEGRRQYRVDAARRRSATARPARNPADHQVIVGQIGDRVAHRSLAFYQAIGERLAIAGGRP